ncbi:argininosuccinate synthase [Luteitalea sp. TBR-22]|uniref:argininosuccinate synthase domain-containing protein n=1 Tax=Luteitalea sp. TBR-22 TaxID=2802971 RepID=UPI001AF35BFE|nr:argininosuccinate synthase domain-containing protein [Luteitalea sp. TBR-22]BCS31594.1 argininosuccinate synthase [Luteitalea sp. TBR-22]
MTQPRVVLAHAGDAGTLCAIPWLAREAEVVTVTVDVGQGDSLLAVRERALEAGAVRAHVLDARETFAHDMVLPALRAGAVGFDGDPHAAVLALPCVAAQVATVAAMEQADALAHGGSGQAAARMARLLGATSRIPVYPSVETMPAEARAAAMAQLQADVEGVPAARATLWGRSLATAGDLAAPVAEALFSQTRAATRGPEAPATLDLHFEGGTPRRVNGVAMPLVELLSSLDTIAAAHGVGRVDVLVPEGDGVRREVAEAPAATVLQVAFRELEALTLPWSLRTLRRRLAESYVDLLRTGDWHGLTRASIDALADRALKDATATILLRLYKGGVQVVGRERG